MNAIFRKSRAWLCVAFIGAILFRGMHLQGAEDALKEFRPPKDETDLRFWLENMVWYHHFQLEEVVAATGLQRDAVASALSKFNIRPDNGPSRSSDATLLILPYPGGRHPRVGFLEGAIRPQRETKVSIFTPWDQKGYVVLDVPEAIWSNLGLLYLAHTHVPTIWVKQGIELPQLEWHRGLDGTLDIERELPDGVIFGAKVIPTTNAVRMKLWLKNGSKERLTDLRVQNCVMLKEAIGFDRPTNENKIFSDPYVACRSTDGRRWIITAWVPCHRTWANAPVPCLHSDPKFPDCAPGETKQLQGWLSFYEGTDVKSELKRIEETGWKEAKLD